MFCPNCGEDCGNNRFCSECGTQLQKVAEPLESSAQNLPKMSRTKSASIEIPTSSGYLGEGGTSVVLNHSSVTVCTGLGYRKFRTEIPYDQLVTVIYLRPSYKPWRIGALLFRGEKNKDIPVPDINSLGFDVAAVKISLDKDTLFYHIFQMLKAVAPSTAKFEMIIPETKIRKLDEMARNVDLNYFWDEYAPYRKRAMNEIRAQHGINIEAARILVDRVFDAKQKRLYTADPFDAIRDLNLIVGDMKNASRLKNELREHRKLEKLEKSVGHIELMMMLDDK